MTPVSNENTALTVFIYISPFALPITWLTCLHDVTATTGYAQELKERMFVFQIVNESDVEKLSFLRALCRNIANANFRSDPDTLLRRMKPDDLGLDASDLNVAANFGSSVYRSIHRKVRTFLFI